MIFGREARRILAYQRPVDMRKSFHGLVALVQGTLHEDVLSGVLFVFLNRRGTYLKGVYWDRTGFCLFAKRLEHGRFVFPGDSDKQEISARAFELILDGIVLGGRHRRGVEMQHDHRRESSIAQP